MQAYDRQAEQRKTRSMLFRFFSIAILMPFASGALVYGYHFFSSQAWERRDWKLVVLCIWIGTMLSLLWDAFRLLRVDRAHGTAAVRYVTKDQTKKKEQVAASSIQRWESKRSRKILRELSFTALVLPLGACALVYAYEVSTGANFERSDWKNVFFVVWICSLLGVIRVARKAKNDSLLYKTSSSATPRENPISEA